MKKLFIILTVVLMLSSTMVVSAEETTTTKQSPEDRFNGFLLELEEKQDARYDEIDSKWSERQDKRQERNTGFLETVAQYAPELLSSYETAFDTHDALHVELFNKRTAIRTTYSDETMAALTILKEDLFAQATAGEITWKEARQSLKVFLQESKDSYVASKTTYKDTVLAAKTDWEANVVEIKALRQELRTAIETNDTVTAAGIIEELYDYLLQHIEFDQFKLDTMNSIF